MPALCLSPRLLLPDASPSRQERLQAGGQRSAGGSRGIGAVSKRGRNGTDISAGPGCFWCSALCSLPGCCCRASGAVPESVRPQRWPPTGSSVPGILQARTLERVTIAFSTLTRYRVLNVITADHRIPEPRLHLRLVALPLRPSFKNLHPRTLASASPSYPRKMREKGQLDHPPPHKL